MRSIIFEAHLFWFMAYRKKNITSIIIFLVLNNPIWLFFCVMTTQQVVWIVLYACYQIVNLQACDTHKVCELAGRFNVKQD